MNAARHVTLALLTVALLAACGVEELLDDDAAATPTPTRPVTEPAPADPTPTDPTEEPTDMDAAQQTITGTLGGDPVLEGGCAWLDTGDGARYEVLWPEGYRVEWEPLQLVGPDGDVVATSGEELEVSGSVSRDMASICMVGTIFEATRVSTP